MLPCDESFSKELYLRLEQELGDKFKLAYNIMKEEVKKYKYFKSHFGC